MKDLNIKHIVVAGLELKAHYPQEFKYLEIPVRDHRKEDITQFFNSSYEFIKAALEKE